MMDCNINNFSMTAFLKTKIIILAILSFGICGLTKSSLAVTTATCDGSVSDCQAKINAASDGDTINIAAGSFTWASHLGWTNKNINLIGAGIDQTVVTTAAYPAGGNGHAIYITATDPTKAAFRISGMTFQGTNSDVDLIDITSYYATSAIKGWRIDHVRFNYSTDQVHYIGIRGVSWGLIDHCTFDAVGNIGVNLEGDSSGDTLLGDLYWTHSLNLGTDEAVYIEDCTFNYNAASSSAFNSGQGGSVVFRYNTINGTYFQTHTPNSNKRGGMKYEVYNNVFTGTCAICNGGKFLWPFWVRSGTGVVFNNSITNYQITQLTMDNQRTFYNDGAPLSLCDGTHPTYDGNVGTGNQVGWPCIDQIGRTGLYPSQISAPLYAWMNGAQSDCATTRATCTDTVRLTLNNDGTGLRPWMRDHIKTTGDADPHPGNVVDYVNNGTTPMPGYTPYTYPHPLQGNSDTTPPAAPTGLSVN
jgi:hypothetical protein